MKRIHEPSVRGHKAGTVISGAIGLVGIVASLTPFVQTTGLLTTVVPMICGAAILAGFMVLDDMVRGFKALRLVKNAENLGIRNVSRSDAAHDLIIRDYMERNKPVKELRLMLYGGGGLKTLCESGYLKKIVVEDKAVVKIILASPDSDFIRELEEIEGEAGRIRRGVEQTTESIKRVLKEARQEHVVGSITIRHYNTQIRSALTLINDEAGFLTLSLAPSFGPTTASLELFNNGEDSLFGKCSKHFNAVWERCKGVGV
jgi:hypothetical protein